jgi:hypothetical protein
MTKKTMYAILVILLAAATLFSFFRVVDAALEIDDLKSQIHLQQKGMQFMQSVANDALSSCVTTISKFENISRANGFTVLWQDQVALVGPFRVTKKNSCVLKIEQVGLFYKPQ